MTEQEIQQDDTSQNQDLESSSFWSPWAIFFLGIIYAALNWWRMGKKRKAIVFLAIFILLGFVYDWFNVRNSSWVDLELKQTVLFTNLIVSLILQILLAVIVWRDQRKFEQSGETPFPTHWTIILKFFAVMLIFAGLRYCLYNLPTVFGDCGVPRFQDVVYQAKLANRTGVEKIFLSRNDFNYCNWVWFYESDKTDPVVVIAESVPGQTSFYYGLDGGPLNNTPQRFNRMRLDENIYLFDQPVTKEHFTSFIGDNFKEKKWSVLDVSKYAAQIMLSEAHCKKFDPSPKACDIYLADRSVIVKLSFLLDQNDEIDQYVMQAIQKTAQRLLAYNQSP